MSRKVTIALDAMGGDLGPDAVVPAALATLERDDSVSLTLVGLPDVLEQTQRQAKDRYGDRLAFKAATEVVSMDEPPADALRRKKDLNRIDDFLVGAFRTLRALNQKTPGQTGE